MIYGEKTVTLTDGRECLIRSPLAEDAKIMLEYLRAVSGETDNLVSFPDEIQMTLDEERAFLQDYAENEKAIMIAAFVDGRLAGNSSITQVSPRRKMTHRATLGIALYSEFWGLGIGKILMDALIETAKESGFTQLELGVVDGNERAISLYKKYGFTEFGRLPNAFIQSDGKYADEVQMVMKITS